MEIWKPIESIPGLEASSIGRIRALPYLGSMPQGGTRTYSGQPTFGQWDKIEERYNYRFKRIKKTFRVARLVREAFHGPCPPDKPNCLHIDENPQNNCPENLKWGTQKENLNAPGFLMYCARRVRNRALYRKENAHASR